MNFSCVRTLDLEMIPNIETVTLEVCTLLVELHMPVECSKLRALNLRRCEVLRTLNLGSTPKLETLNLEGCHDLVQLHMPFQCPKLKSLILNCPKLMTVSLGSTPDLEMLTLEGCHDLLELHMPCQCPKLKSLILNCPKLRILNLGSTPDLEMLTLERCRDLLEFHMPCRCPKLRSLILNCPKLMTLEFGPTLDLETLSILECDLLELHMPNECPNLKSLNVYSSKYHGQTLDLEISSLAKCPNFIKLNMPFGYPKLKYVSLLSSTLTTHYLLSTPEFKTSIDILELQIPFLCPKLKSLRVNVSNWLLNTFCMSEAQSSNTSGLSPDFETLSLKGSDDVLELNMTIYGPKPKPLILGLYCSKLRTLEFGLTLELETLSIQGCDLLELHMPNECPNLKSLSVNSSKLRTLNFGKTLGLETVSLERCPHLIKLNMPFGCPKLKSLSLSDSTWRTLDLGQTPNLERLDIRDCFDLVELHCRIGSLHLIARSVDIYPLHSNGNLQKFLFSIGNLKKLTLEGSIPEVPKDLERLVSLEELSLLSVKIQHLPDSICMLKHLRLLKLKSCWLIEKLPEHLGQLEYLEELYLTDCILLRDVSESVCELKCLKYFHLPYCMLLEKLPKELGRLECLKELNIEGAGITHLPQSIFRLEGLRITGSRWQLQSYGFTSVYPVSIDSSYIVYCYI